MPDLKAAVCRYADGTRTAKEIADLIPGAYPNLVGEMARRFSLPLAAGRPKAAPRPNLDYFRPEILQKKLLRIE